MGTIVEKQELEELLLQQSTTLSNWLHSKSELWAEFSSIFALFLFVIWSVRFVFDLVAWVFLVDLYTLGILVAIRKSNYHTSFQESNGKQRITFMKPGIAWKRITDSVVGLAIISSAFVYMFSNALPTNPEFVSLIYTLTLIIHVLIIPVVPVLSRINSLPILKSKITVLYTNVEIISITPEIHPLDIQISVDDLIIERKLSES